MNWDMNLNLYIRLKSDWSGQNRLKFLELFGLILNIVNIGILIVGTS